ncbi:MAG: YraN family protein [Candidatus Babeliales bacterium]
MNLGTQGESLVAQFIQKQGFTILERNYKKFYGEVDIIAKKEDLVIFVEVKTRTTHQYNLSEVITYGKQKKIIKAAQHYIASKQLTNKVFRFDVALIQGAVNENSLQYIPNAFTKQERYG